VVHQTIKLYIGLSEFGTQIRMHYREFIKQPSEYDRRRQRDIPLIHQEYEYDVLPNMKDVAMSQQNC